MDEKFKKTSEDAYADADFSDEDSELKDAQFISVKPKEIKITRMKDGVLSQFFGENKKLLGEKIIEKKSGAIIEIKYNNLGNKKSINIYDKNKRLRKATDYYENGVRDMVTDYGLNGSYTSTKYSPDGARVSYVEKFPDGTAEAFYYDVDKKGSTLHIKMDAYKEIIEKKLE